MSTKLRLKLQSKYKRELPKKFSLRHCHLENCGKKQKEIRTRRRDLSRRTKISLTKVADKNVIDVIKSISGSSNNNSKRPSSVRERKVSRRDSEGSVVYVDTTYIKSEMPRKESVIDLTKSDTTILTQYSADYNFDYYDISGDNIIDELRLRDQVSSAASIFTILPPQPPNLFTSPSDELCVCHRDLPCCLLLANKRNLSTSDVSYHSSSNRAKRVAGSRSRIPDRINADSSDCVWKLKKSYPLTNGLCTNRGELKDFVETMDCDINIFDIVEDLEKEYNISNSQHSALTGELNALKVATVLDSNVTNV